jgi:hypothetical protein
MLGLVAVGAYTNYTNADDSPAHEADAVDVLYRDASNCPEAQRSEPRSEILCYIDATGLGGIGPIQQYILCR